MNRPVSVLGFAVTLSLCYAGCGGDPHDPQTWIGKLDRGAEREEAIEKIREIFRDTLNKNGGNADAAPVKALAGRLTPPLVAAARKYKDDHKSREEILKLL